MRQPSNETWGFYFSGHLVLEAVLDALDAQGLTAATEIMLTGDSAGGIGVWPNLDYLAQRYPRARVVGAPVAGFYFYAYPYTGVNHTSSDLADFRPEAWPQHYALWQSFVDQDCLKAMAASPWACVLANNSVPYVSTPVFITQSLSDQVVLLAHDWVPPAFLPEGPTHAYVQQWTNNMTYALGLFDSTPQFGVFGAACFIHTGFTPTSPIVGDRNFYQAFGNWYFNRGGPKNSIDNCGIFCNPTCPQPTVV